MRRWLTDGLVGLAFGVGDWYYLDRLAHLSWGGLRRERIRFPAPRIRLLPVAIALLCSLCLAACLPVVERPLHPGREDSFEYNGTKANYRVHQRLVTKNGTVLAFATYQLASPTGRANAYCSELTDAGVADSSLAFKSCAPGIPSWTSPFELAATFTGHDTRLGDYSITSGMVTDASAAMVRVTWEDGVAEDISLAGQRYYVATRDIRLAHPPRLEAMDAEGTVIATGPAP